MICYRDMTFCSKQKECSTVDCHRKLNEKDDAWLKINDWMPVCMSDMSGNCGKYQHTDAGK